MPSRQRKEASALTAAKCRLRKQKTPPTKYLQVYKFTQKKT
jgi:hypothetical protein